MGLLHINLIDGKGLDASPVWDQECHNWAASLQEEESKEGYKRKHWFKAGTGTAKYTLPEEGLQPGDPVVFMVERTDGSLHSIYFGIVYFLNDVSLVLEQCDTGKAALARSKDFLQNLQLGAAGEKELPDPANPLTIVNAILEFNVRRVCNVAIADGVLPGLMSGMDRAVLARDVPAGRCLVAGLGALAVGMQWQTDEQAALLPGFTEALLLQPGANPCN